MIQCQRVEEGGAFEFRLSPSHRLSRRPPWGWCAAVGLAVLGTSGMAWAAGTVLTPAWACVEAPVVLGLLAFARRKAGAWECIRVTPHEIVVESSRHAPCPSLATAWTRVSSERGKDGRIHVSLAVDRQAVEVGRLLDDQERLALAADLRGLLRRTIGLQA